MILASAQTNPLENDIYGNLKQHYRIIELALDHGADLIVFPEMSVTGYHRENGKKIAFSGNDPRLDPLRKLAADRNIIIIIGAPLSMENELYIGAFILYPDQTVSVYTKQFLHSGEEQFYKSSFDHNPIIELNNERFSLAICADIENQVHPENAHKVNSTFYITSIFFSVEGMTGAYKKLENYAKKYKMHILMSNYCGRCWGLDAGGRSAFWDSNGELIAILNDRPGLLVVEKNKNKCTGKTLEI